MSDMSEQVELVGGPLDGQAIVIPGDRDRLMVHKPVPIEPKYTARPGAFAEYTTVEYRRDPSSPRRFVYV